jgi:hypothetical protein
MTRIAKPAVAAGALMALVAGVAVSAPAQAADELSEKSVQSIMDYAWSLVPQQFTKPDGKTITVDKKKKEEVMVPLDVAREAIRVGYVSGRAQVCGLSDDMKDNYNSLIRREITKKKWTDQQILYISQLHLTTVIMLTGQFKLVEKNGDKEALVEELATNNKQTCTDDQRAKVKETIATYVKAGPALASAEPAAPAATPAAATAAAPAPAAAPAAAKPAAGDVKPAAEKKK